MGTLDGRVAVVTGAGTGIGAGIAKAYAAAGARQAISASGSYAAAAALADELTADGAETIALQSDFRTPANARDVVRAAMERFGRVDILVNNAGYTLDRPFLETSEADWVSLFNINLQAMFATCHEVLPHMVERSSGRIINLSSVHGALHAPGHVIYGASKGGINAFTRALAVEFAPHHITANVIAPGVIYVDRYDREGRDLDVLRAIVPNHELGGPADVAGAAVYLASDAAGYVSGEVLYVDAGLTAKMAID